MSSRIQKFEIHRQDSVVMGAQTTSAETFITDLLKQEPFGFMLRSFYEKGRGKGNVAKKILRIITSPTHSRQRELLGSLISAVSELPPGVQILDDENTYKLLLELQKEKIKEHLDPQKKTVAVYFPDSAYRGQTGGILNKLKAANHNTAVFVGSICHDEHEKAKNVYYGGHGIIEHMDFVDLFICATYAHDLPKNSKKVYFVHDIHDSPVSKEGDVLKMILEYDYHFTPSTAVLDRIKKQIGQAKAEGFLKEEKEIGLIPGGYIKLDQNLKLFKKHKKEAKVIIHAPTVVDSDIEDYACLPRHSEKIVGALLENFPGYKIIFRPHPHTVNTLVVSRIVKKFKNNPRFIFDNDPSFYMGNYAKSALMVTDFSGTAFTYAFTTLRPVVFFSHNEQNFQKNFGDFKFVQDREKVGRVANNIDELIANTKSALKGKNEFQSRTRKYRDSVIFNLGHAEKYFVENVDCILNGQRHSDWDYLKLNPAPPQLSEEGYKGFNVVKFKDKFFALSQELGHVDLENVNLSELGLDSKCFVGSSEAEVKTYVDWMLDSEELTRESEQKSQEIERLKNIISRDEANKAALMTELEEKIGLLEKLMMEVGQLEERVQALTAEMEERVRALTVEMEENNRKAEALKGEVSDRNLKIEALMGEAADRKTREEALVNEIGEKNIRIENLLIDAGEKGSQIENLLIDAGEKNSQIESLLNTISDKDHQARTLIGENEDRGSKIKTLVDTIKKKNSQAKTMLSEAHERRNQLDQWRGEASENKVKVEALMVEVGEKDSQAEALARELELRDKWIKLLREKFKTTAHQNEDYSQELEKIKSSFLYRLIK